MLNTVIRNLTIATLGMAVTTVCADPVVESFYPYHNAVPRFPGLGVGMTIDQDNVEQFEEVLDPVNYEHIRQGWTALQIGRTQSFELHPKYVAASQANLDEVTLDENGLVANYVAGRPFPHDPDPGDPQAGLKLAWNYQYGFNAGDSEVIDPFWWSFKNLDTGKVERVLKFKAHFLKFAQRVTLGQTPEVDNNPAGLYRALYLVAREPFDIKNTQLLIHRYKNDLKRDDAWLYFGFQRRVRRLATGQISDAFLGTDLMIEDFEGYNARISDYDWRYLESKNLLLAFYYHNEQKLEPQAPGTRDGYKFVRFGGQGGCFPEVTWQLRKVHVIDGTPKDPQHPLSRRRVYLDAQTATMGRVINFDQKGGPVEELHDRQGSCGSSSPR